MDIKDLALGDLVEAGGAEWKVMDLATNTPTSVELELVDGRRTAWTTVHARVITDRAPRLSCQDSEITKKVTS